MSLPFDPADKSVKDALKASSNLSDEELDAVYEAELDGKARKSLLDGITQLREDLHAPASEEAVPSTASAKPPLIGVLGITVTVNDVPQS